MEQKLTLLRASVNLKLSLDTPIFREYKFSRRVGLPAYFYFHNQLENRNVYKRIG